MRKSVVFFAVLCIGLGAGANVLEPGPRTERGGGGCPDWMCTSNGTQLTGIVLDSIERAPATRGGYAVAAKQTISGGGKRGCDDYGCGSTNGTSRNGFAPKDLDLEQIQSRATEVFFTQRTSR